LVAKEISKASNLAYLASKKAFEGFPPTNHQVSELLEKAKG